MTSSSKKTIAAPLPREPQGLDSRDFAEIEVAQDAMRALIATIPRRFSYPDEFDFSFRCKNDA